MDQAASISEMPTTTTTTIYRTKKSKSWKQKFTCREDLTLHSRQFNFENKAKFRSDIGVFSKV